MKRKKLIFGLLGVVVVAAIAYANVGMNRTSATSVTTEKVTTRDLEAIVSASGKIEPKSSIDISAGQIHAVPPRLLPCQPAR